VSPRTATQAPRDGRQDRPGRLIRQASAWATESEPRVLSLQELEQSEDIRWVDVDATALDGLEALALLAPICRDGLTGRMIRDLITPSRFPAGRNYPGGRVSITAAFRTRHLQSDDADGEAAEVVSVFEPVHLLMGDGWLITAWLPRRVFRGSADDLRDLDDRSQALYHAVAERWRSSEASSAEELADLVRRELAVACGYRTPEA